MSEAKNVENDYEGGQQPFRALTPGGHPQDTSQPAFPVYHRKFANPSPLGLFSFAGTTFVLSLYNIQARGITAPNVVVGLALAYGGLCQFTAGIWEFASGNTYGATGFCSFGAFWWSYAVIQIPFFGVVKGQVNPNGVPEDQLASALGIYLMMWFIISSIMFIASFRASVGLLLLFFFLSMCFLLLAISNLAGSLAIQKAGGAFGIIAAAIAFYVGSAGLLTPDTSYFTLPVVDLSRKD